MKMEYAKRIWIDLENSPHVPFFKPIIEKLEQTGYQITITARDCFQVCDLADYHGLNYKKIGRHHGKNIFLKVIGLFYRAFQLSREILSNKYDIGLSHGSRSQMILCSIFRIPCVVLDDYEPSKGLILFKPKWVIMPEVIPVVFGNIDPEHVLQYPGIKEDVYVPSFRPDPSILDQLNIPESGLLVAIRPPATEAHYHNPESEILFEEVIDYFSRYPSVCMALLPRTENQGNLARRRWPELFKSGRIFIPDQVVDGLNLIWHADLVVSGGGTMNREAAALGVPVYSIFRGPIGSVDRYLASVGKLVFIEKREDIREKIQLKQRDKVFNPINNGNRAALKTIVDHIIGILENKS